MDNAVSCTISHGQKRAYEQVEDMISRHMTYLQHIHDKYTHIETCVLRLGLIMTLILLSCFFPHNARLIKCLNLIY